MMPITAAQLAQARTLVAKGAALSVQLSQLTPEAQRLRRLGELSDKHYNERCRLTRHPERLAGFAELAQRNTPRFQEMMAREYDFLLLEMFRPLPHIEQGLPAPRPLQVDFHALPVAARPYLLGPYLGVHPGDRFARLCLKRSLPSRGRLVVIQNGGPVDADLWRGHLPRINAWLGGAWAVTEVTANTVTLVQRAELPAAIPMKPGYLRQGSLFLGFNIETQAPTYLPFVDLTSGTFIVGAAGSGKSNATHLIMHSILANLHLFQAVFCVDGKEGMTFARYRNAAPAKLRILSDEADLWKLTSQLVAVTRARNATLAKAGLDKAPNNFIAVIIEEMSTYTADPASTDKATRAAHTQFINDLASLARKGRSAGLKIIITAQDPTKEQVPTAVRANCQTSLIFRLGIDQHATTMLGELTPTTDPRKLTTGRALLKRDNGTVTTLQFPMMPEPGGRP